MFMEADWWWKDECDLRWLNTDRRWCADKRSDVPISLVQQTLKTDSNDEHKQQG